MSFLKLFFISIVTIFDTIRVLFLMSIKGKDIFHIYAKKWAKKLLIISGVKLKVIDYQLIDENQSYIFIANHSSLMDIPVLLATLPGDCRIIYKKELESIPVFGYGLKKSSFIGIEREDPRKAMQSIQKAIEILKQGASIIIFPEGTRNKQGTLSEFKRGAFLIAEKSTLPIVPLVIKGTDKILKNGSLKLCSGEVEMIFKPLINTKDMDKNELKNLNNTVFEIIKSELEK